MPYFYENRCSATIKIWMDDYKKISYISITIYYINYNWELNSNFNLIYIILIQILHVGQLMKKAESIFFQKSHGCN